MPDLVLDNVLLPSPGSGLVAPSGSGKSGSITLCRNKIVEVSSTVDGRGVDLGGACVLPGFVDAHTHLGWAAEDYWNVRWAEVRDRAHALSRLSTVAARIAPEFWVLGGDWLPSELAENELPELAELDAVTGDKPMFLRARDYSLAVLNSAALRRCGIGRGTVHPEQDWIDRDERGRPTGRLRGPAVWGRLAAGVVPPANTHRKLAELRALLADLARRGITEVHDIATYPDENHALPTNFERSHTDLRLIDALLDAGELTVRVGYRLPLPRVTEHDRLAVPHLLDDRVFPAGYKVFVDDGWFDCADSRRVDEFRYQGAAETLRLLWQADDHGAPVSFHAIGDLGVGEALDLITKLPNRRGTGLPPHRLVHARRMHREDVLRCAEFGVLVESQPWEVAGLAEWFTEPRFAPCTSLISPYARLLAAGVEVAFGTDRRLCMREDLLDADPLAGVQVAVTRQWSGPVQQPEECLTVDQALRCMTATGAAATGAGDRRGVLRAGADADLVVLGGDPWSVDPAGIAKIPVLATIADGRIVHDALGIFG